MAETLVSPPRKNGLARAGSGVCRLVRGAMAAMAACVCMAATVGGAEGFEWELIKYEGRDYVTKESIHSFYRFAKMEANGDAISFLSPTLEMKAVAGKQDLYINNVRFVLSYPVIKYNGRILFSRLDLAKLIDPVLRPSYIQTAKPFDTVVIDPGHGGHDSGARGTLGNEKDFALKLANELKDTLSSRGFKVQLTRTTDKFLTLEQRVGIANSVPNSIFISLHFNAGQSSAHGIETFALSPQGSSSTISGPRSTDAVNFSGNRLDSENIALATAVHASVLHRIPAIDRGIKRARWAVLRGIDVPAILFEGGFVTNSTECRKIASPTHRKQLSEAIAEAVMNYRAALQGR